jgi:hypothetical protein
MRATYLLRRWVADGLDKVGDLVAHGLGRYTGGGSLEVHLTLAAKACRVAPWHEGIHGDRTVKATTMSTMQGTRRASRAASGGLTWCG